MSQDNLGFLLRLLSTRCRWLMKRDSPHPAVKQHWRNRFDVDQIRRSAETAEPFALRAGPSTFEITVRPEPVFAEGAEVVVLDDNGESERFPVESVTTFAGSVAGDPESEVRLSILGRTLEGYVKCRGEWWFIDSMRRFDRAARADDHLVYRPTDLVFREHFGQDGKRARGDAEGGGVPYRTNPHIGLAVWADLEFRSQADVIGANWWDVQASLINKVNGIFRREVGATFGVRAFVIHIGSVLSSSNADTLLDQFGMRVRAFHGDLREVEVRRRTDIEAAHLTTGKNLDGRTLGIAWQPGAWSLSQQQLYYIGGGGGLFGDLFGGPNLSYKNLLTAAHELGHNFNGDHDAAKEICVSHFIVCWDHERTLMWPTLYSDNRDEFSNGNDDRVGENLNGGRNSRFIHR